MNLSTGIPATNEHVGAAAPGHAILGQGRHATVGTPDLHGQLAMADDHVPELHDGGPVVDAVADDLVAVL